MYITNVKNVREYPITEKGVSGVKVKYLLHKGVGAENLQLRLFTIDVGGHTPLEKHAHEHEVYILKGHALVKGGDEKKIVGPGDVIFIASYEPHQFTNIGDTAIEFLCTIGSSSISSSLFWKFNYK